MFLAEVNLKVSKSYKVSKELFFIEVNIMYTLHNFINLYINTVCHSFFQVKCAQELCFVLKKPSLNYADTVEATFQVGANKRLKRYSKLAR